MKLVEMNFTPTDRHLRQFGLVALVALPLLGWLWGGGWTTIGITGGIGAVLAAGGLLYPRAIKPVFLALSLLALPIGMVVSELAMALVFFGMVVPMGLIFRLIGRDALKRRIDRRATTYWQRKRQPTDAASYLRQW